MGSMLQERLDSRRDELLSTFEQLGATNVRVFGSVARGEDGPDSDIDLLVDLKAEVGLFWLARMAIEAERILGVAIDVVPADSLKPHVRPSALRDAVPV